MQRQTEYLNFQQHLDDILNSDGKLVLPNIKEVLDPQEALNLLGRTTKQSEIKPYNFLVQTFDPPLNDVQTKEVTYYPKIFLNTRGMGGTFDGSGILLVSKYPNSKVFTFFMCEHVWNESGANHNRGWHPKTCTKCGFDASIDSGD